jgi:hypothetical protein
MKVLYICFDWESPAGKTNLRVLQGLLMKGIECKVICAQSCDELDSKILYVCGKFPSKPSRLFEKIGNILGKDLIYYFWGLRAKRKAKQICKLWMPEIVYARANPATTFTVGLYISRKIGKPLFLHTVDPIPPTPDWNNNFLYRRKKLKTVSEPLSMASGISFINEEMMFYQQSMMNFNIIKRCFISPNPLPILDVVNKISLPKKDSGKFICLYLGSFFGSRSPELLLKGFEFIISKYPFVELHLIGTNENLILQKIKNKEVATSIKIIPKVKECIPFLAKADLLLDVDSSYVPQVFTSSKLMDYLPMKCPILCLTPAGSATRNLLADCNKSILFCDHDFNSLIKTLEYAIIHRSEYNDYSDRDILINTMNINNIASSLIQQFQKHAY